MVFENIIHAIPGWMNSEGPESGIVISSRARLARNIPGYPYAHRASEGRLGEIVETVLDASSASGFDSSRFIRNEELDDLQKSILVERHLISPALVAQGGSRGVLVIGEESSSILVNEEDHLRIQSMSSGLNPLRAWEEVDSLDDRLARAIPFSFSRRFGYLTACPTNLGTGLRISILIHLPAIALTNDIPRMVRSAAQIGLAVRGCRGEGSDVVGNLFQVSNQASLGKTEREILEEISTAAQKIIEYEKRAAETLVKEAKSQIEDKIYRSVGILKSARVLSTGELMNLGSAVRLGLFLGMLSRPDLRSLNELTVMAQPGHLQGRQGRLMDQTERDVVRASIVRERFLDVRV